MGTGAALVPGSVGGARVHVLAMIEPHLYNDKLVWAPRAGGETMFHAALTSR